MRSPLLRSLVVGSLLVAGLMGLVALAEELTPELSAHIKEEQRAAVEKVNKAHGNKKPSELSSAERRQVIQEQAAAEQAVLDQHEVSGKDFARYSATQSLADREREKAELARIEAKKGAGAQGAPTPEGAVGGDIEFERGDAGVQEEPQDAGPPTRKMKSSLRHRSR